MLDKAVKVAIVGKDIPYFKALVRYFSTIGNDLIFEIRGAEVGEKNQGSVDEDILITDIEAVKNRADIFISDSPGDNSIYKYSGGHEIYKRILQICFERFGLTIKPLYSGSTTWVYVGSSSGGTGKTCVSMGLAEAISRFQDREVLYIPLGAFVYEEGEEQDSTGSYKLEDYLYFLFSDREINLRDFLVEMPYGVKRFRQGEGINPLKLMVESELQRFFDSLSDSGIFKYIIVDGGDYNTCDKLAIKFARNICQVETEATLKKGEKLLRHIMRDDLTSCDVGHGEEEHIINILNKVETEDLIFNREMPAKGEIIMEPIKIYKEKKEKGEALSLDREFGEGIKVLLNRLTTS